MTVILACCWFCLKSSLHGTQKQTNVISNLNFGAEIVKQSTNSFFVHNLDVIKFIIIREIIMIM